MTEALARYLAAAFTETGYFAKKIRGEWVVWCAASDHAVEFDNIVVLHAKKIIGENR